MSLQKLTERLKDRALIEIAEGKKLYTPEEVLRLIECVEVYHRTIENLRAESKINGPKMDKMIVRNYTGIALITADQIALGDGNGK